MIKVASTGVKRSLLTEGHGVPIGLAIEGAQRHDMKLVRPTIQSLVVERPEASVLSLTLFWTMHENKIQVNALLPVIFLEIQREEPSCWRSLKEQTVYSIASTRGSSFNI